MKSLAKSALIFVVIALAAALVGMINLMLADSVVKVLVRCLILASQFNTNSASEIRADAFKVISWL